MPQIINLEEKDLSILAKLYVEVFNSEPWNDKWTYETAYRRIHDIYQTPNFLGLVYYDEYLKGAILGNIEQFYVGLHYNLKEMFVRKELQGSEIGSKLIKHLEIKLKSLDVETIILFSSVGNKTSEFYLKNGFEIFTSMAMLGKDI